MNYRHSLEQHYTDQRAVASYEGSIEGDIAERIWALANLALKHTPGEVDDEAVRAHLVTSFSNHKDGSNHPYEVDTWQNVIEATNSLLHRT